MEQRVEQPLVGVHRRFLRPHGHAGQVGHVGLVPVVQIGRVRPHQDGAVLQPGAAAQRAAPRRPRCGRNRARGGPRSPTSTDTGAAAGRDRAPARCAERRARRRRASSRRTHRTCGAPVTTMLSGDTPWSSMASRRWCAFHTSVRSGATRISPRFVRLSHEKGRYRTGTPIRWAHLTYYRLVRPELDQRRHQDHVRRLGFHELLKVRVAGDDGFGQFQGALHGLPVPCHPRMPRQRILPGLRRAFRGPLRELHRVRVARVEEPQMIPGSPDRLHHRSPAVAAAVSGMRRARPARGHTGPSAIGPIPR